MFFGKMPTHNIKIYGDICKCKRQFRTFHNSFFHKLYFFKRGEQVVTSVEKKVEASRELLSHQSFLRLDSFIWCCLVALTELFMCVKVSRQTNILP